MLFIDIWIGPHLNTPNTPKYLVQMSHSSKNEKKSEHYFNTILDEYVPRYYANSHPQFSGGVD